MIGFVLDRIFHGEEYDRMRILLIEDDPKLNEALCCALRQEGYEVDACLDGGEGLYYMETGSADLILLDRMLPGLSGTELLRQRRRAGDTTPVLILTAMGTLTDRIEGLDLGADDYLIKPFAVEELMARIRSISRRGSGFHVASDELSLGDLTLKESSCQLSGPKGECTLSRRECGLLAALLRHPGQTLSRGQLLLGVWGPDSEVEDGNLDNYIFFLRKRFRTLSSRVSIQTIRGVGYRLEDGK